MAKQAKTITYTVLRNDNDDYILSENPAIWMCGFSVREAFDVGNRRKRLYFEVTTERPKGNNFHVISWSRVYNSYRLREVASDCQYALMKQAADRLTSDFNGTRRLYVSVY